jgi:hypothetical protein
MAVLEKDRMACPLPSIPIQFQRDQPAEKAVPRNVEEHMLVIASMLFDILWELTDGQKVHNRHI